MKYIVIKGDTLSKIAKKHNVSLETIVKINNIADPNKIFVGQVLHLSENSTISTPVDYLNEDNLLKKYNSFVNYVESKKIKKPLSPLAKECILDIFKECLEQKITDVRKLSYILATVHWETGAYGQKYIYEPVREQGLGKTRYYGVPHKKTNQIYYGRGLVQITLFDNYERFTKILNNLGYKVDLVNNPDQALNARISVLILILGMKLGKFTGADLDDYFTESKTDWYNARKIINGLDKAVIIQDIAKEFYFILK